MGSWRKNLDMDGIPDFLFEIIVDAVRQVNIQLKKRAQEAEIFDYLTRQYKFCISCCDLHMTIYTALRIARDAGYIQEENYNYWMTGYDPASLTEQQPCSTPVVQQRFQGSEPNAREMLFYNKSALGNAQFQQLVIERNSCVPVPPLSDLSPQCPLPYGTIGPQTQFPKTVPPPQQPPPRAAEQKHPKVPPPALPAKSLRPPILKRRPAFGINENKPNRIAKHVIIVDKPVIFRNRSMSTTGCTDQDETEQANATQNNSTTLNEKQDSEQALKYCNKSSKYDEKAPNVQAARRHKPVLKRKIRLATLVPRPIRPIRKKAPETRKTKVPVPKPYLVPAPTTWRASYMAMPTNKQVNLRPNPKPLRIKNKGLKKLRFPLVPKKCLLLKKKIEDKKRVLLRNVAQQRLKHK